MTYQILTNDDKVCIPSFSSILLAVLVGDILYSNGDGHSVMILLSGSHIVKRIPISKSGTYVLWPHILN